MTNSSTERPVQDTEYGPVKGGSGVGEFKPVRKLTADDIQTLRVGDILIDYSRQFQALNLGRVVEVESDKFYIILVDPKDTTKRRMAGDVERICIWNFDIGKSSDFYTVAKPVDYKITSNQRRLLVEALRRWDRFGRMENKPLAVAWTGLGTATDYKSVSPEYMSSVHGHSHRHDQWWKLTEKGAAIVQFWYDMGYRHYHIEGELLPPTDGSKLTEPAPVRARLCVRLLSHERQKMADIRQNIVKMDSSSFFDSEQNPITFWVTTILTRKQIAEMPGVEDVIYAQ